MVNSELPSVNRIKFIPNVPLGDSKNYIEKKDYFKQENQPNPINIYFQSSLIHLMKHEQIMVSEAKKINEIRPIPNVPLEDSKNFIERKNYLKQENQPNPINNYFQKNPSTSN